MKYGQVAVLLLVFLTAILLHYLLLKKEGFEAAQRTPLTKENVQSLMDQFIQDLLSQYLDFKKDALKEAKTNLRVKYRLVDIGNMINAINRDQPMIQEKIATFPYQGLPMFSFEDLKLIKDFFFYRIGMSTPKTATEPATAADLDLQTARIQSFSALLGQKAALLSGGNNMINDIQTQTRIALENLKKLKQNLGGMKPTEIPLFRSDLQAIGFTEAATNFVINPAIESSEIPELEVGNLPAGKSMTDAIVSVIAPTTTPVKIAPTPVSTSLPPAEGLKFSELITTLISFSPNAAPSKTASTPITLTTPTASTAADLVGDDKLALAGSNLDERMRGLIKDELKKELDAVKKGPKDAVNDDLASRSTTLNGCASGAKDARSDALAQGQWFRQAADSCPFAQGQQTPSQPPAPQPIDMNDQIRKDSIPCWGCSLK